jgi:phosphatidylserine/phosphatidylglycerophosphate/cardiolipin synthase-like enzyme
MSEDTPSPTQTIQTSAARDGLSLKAYCGDGAVMLAMNLNEHLATDLAGFAIRYIPPQDKAYYLGNRINFTTGLHAASTPEQRSWTSSNLAPFQKFRWVHFPPDVQPGTYTYEVSAMYFTVAQDLKTGPTVQVSMELVPFDPYPDFEMGLTRGYLSSQAYAERFHNAPIRPAHKSIDFDTAPYVKQYEWLGFHARKLLFGFLDECVNDPNITVDAFAYDLDEPDVIRALARLGPRLRLFLDNAALHIKAGAPELAAKALLEQSAGGANVRLGHFRRFAHNKVLIQKRNGQAAKVLTGSANFSVRGLYVQANNMLLFNDAEVAQLYARAFDQAFSDMGGFAKSDIANQWFDVAGTGLPPLSVAFSPHKTAQVSLEKVARAIQQADSSVLFAVMELGGSGDVLDEIKRLGARENVFSYGITQTDKGLKLYKPGQTNGLLASFAYLRGKVPVPFREEWSGGAGQVIHDKFVVVDFNDSDPVVFTGSSNLAAGGEAQNGDNLLAIADPSIATAYAVEAVRLVDHYHFRLAMKGASPSKPLLLKTRAEKKPWWQAYYDPKDIKCTERKLFSK